MLGSQWGDDGVLAWKYQGDPQKTQGFHRLAYRSRLNTGRLASSYAATLSAVARAQLLIIIKKLGIDTPDLSLR